MKTPKYVTAVLLFLITSALSLHAQDTIRNRSVSVQREYRPVIQDAGKINSMPQVLEPNVEKSPAVYSNFNLPLNAGYNIHTLPAADLITDKYRQRVCPAGIWQLCKHTGRLCLPDSKYCGCAP